MSYRERRDIYGPPLKQQDPRALRWSMVGIMCMNFGLIVPQVARDFDFHPDKEMISWGALALGVLCILGGLIAYRASRCEVARHIAELRGDRQV